MKENIFKDEKCSNRYPPNFQERIKIERLMDKYKDYRVKNG